MDRESKEMVELLNEWIAQGPGTNSVALSASLEIVAALSRNASWGAPKARLGAVRALLRIWFSQECTRAEPRSLCWQQLFDSLWLVETWWSPPPKLAPIDTAVSRPGTAPYSESVTIESSRSDGLSIQPVGS